MWIYYSYTFETRNFLNDFNDLLWVFASFSCAVERQQDHHLFCPLVVGSFVIGTKGLEDEESESFSTGFKTVYKISKNFKTKGSSGFA